MATPLPILFELPLNDLVVIKRALSSLQPLIAQIFLFKLDTSRLDSEGWSKALVDFALCDDPPLPDAACDVAVPCLYPIDVHVRGEMLIKELNFTTSALRRVKGNIARGELAGLELLVTVMGTSVACFEGVNPLALGENPRRLLSSLVEVVTVFLRRPPKWLRSQPTDGVEYRLAYNVVYRALLAIDDTLYSAALAQVAVDCGIVRALCFAEDRFYEVENNFPDRIRNKSTFSDVAARILDHITVYFVYHTVLRPFVRGARQVHRPEVANKQFASRREVLRKAWSKALSNAYSFNTAFELIFNSVPYVNRMKTLLKRDTSVALGAPSTFTVHNHAEEQIGT
ncbi:hypothetical protein PM082_019625 [Marasmius tenuissimus]|nr:hypothetical protein PM082_019625 [Marasmius tenuissimus]